MLTEEAVEGKKQASKALLSNIDIQGFMAKPAFFKNIVNSLNSGRFSNVVSLSLTNCGI